MDKKVTRKEFFENSAKYAAGAILGTAGLKMLSPDGVNADALATPWPWPYEQLDPEEVRVLGHDLFWSGKACCAGSFGAIITALQNKIGSPFTEIPMELMLFGHGGAAGWGTICGALNGSSAAISLVCDKATSDKLINELIGWYTQTELPTDTSNQYAVNHTFQDTRCDVSLPQNLCGSPLCHISVTEWALFAGKKVGDLERKERCARITGDAAAKAAELLNAELAGTFTPGYVPPSTIESCMGCHGSSMLDNVAVKMECQQCHGDPHETTEVAERKLMMPRKYSLEQNYPNPFNPTTNIEFSIPESKKVSLAIFDVRGRLIRTLIDYEQKAPGSYKVTWNGMDDAGFRVSSGIYFSKLQAGQYSQTRKMSLVK